MPQAQAGALVGRTLAGTFRLEAVLSEHALGTLYKGIDVGLDRPIALLAVALREGVAPDRALAAMEPGLKPVAKLRPPRLPHLYRIGAVDGTAAIVLESPSPLTGRGLVGRGQVEVPRVLAIARDVLEALSVAHAAGVAHRALSPDDICLVEEDGAERARVLGV